MRDIRAVSALARELGAKVVLTGLFKHPADMHRLLQQRHLRGQTAEEAMLPSCFKDISLGFMPFTSVFDR
jgi:hypothetical protein